MAFHFSDLGSESAQLHEYSDENGLVPEVGDRWQDFHWDHMLQQQFADSHSGKASWQAFVAQARTHTKVAIEKLRDLEWSGTRHHPISNF
jgi:hypothetical protein